MPATDAYWRNLKKMHKVFAWSCVAMLLATLWMMGDDHGREYFNYQRNFERIQVLQAEARINVIRNQDFENDLAALNATINAAEKRLSQKSKALAELRDELKQRELDYTLAEAKLKLLRSQQTKAAADKGLAIRDAKPDAEIQALLGAYKAKTRQVGEQIIATEKVQAARDETQAKIKAMTKEYDDALEKRKQQLKEVELVEKAKLQLRPDGLGQRFKRWAMELPIIQGFNSHLKIHQDWLPNLKITLGMTKTARFDRCRTCHLGIDKVGAGNVPDFPHGGKAPAHGHATEEQLRKWVKSGKYPHPYSTHPNPDLYLADSSPHPRSTFGCTICHDGNGSGTSFQNAEHGPNSPAQAKNWKKNYHYHANHFWEYPMQPRRLIESSCIKCHHRMEELGRSPKFGNSAPKVFGGYRLIQKYGCFGCHEIHGYERNKSIGPDLRLEPNYTESALQVRWLLGHRTSPTVTGISAKTVAQILDPIVNTPEDSTDARKKLTDLFNHDVATQRATRQFLSALPDMFRYEKREFLAALPAQHLSLRTLALTEQFKKFPHPGKYRKVGPSLRYIKDKTSRDFIAYWTEEPKRFRPSTKMPQFFGLTNHDDIAKQLSPVQIAGIAQYLHDKSQRFDSIPLKSGYKPDPERGKVLFREKGCLACHSRKDAKGTTADFGPDLSRIAAKIKRDPGNPGFSTWLYTWIREPRRYHKRTKMPYMFLKETKVGEVTIDPAADITAYLLKLDSDTKTLFELFKQNNDKDMPTVNAEALRSLVELNVNGKALTDVQFQAFMRSRKYPIDPSQIKGDEIEFTRRRPKAKDPDAEWQRLQLNYVGRKTISQYGCYACHDVPGFERARPIGTTLQNYGRKERSQLAFEHIKQFLEGHGEPGNKSTKNRVETALKQAISGAEKNEADLAAAFFYDSILHHNRPGFVWQKLRAPRSYDYEKLKTKAYDERLRMPKFPISEKEIEQITTFVLGLVAEPPPEQYQYRPKGPAYDRVEGERLLKKYNCVGCHMTDLPKVTYWADLNSRPSLYPSRKAAVPPLGQDLLRELMPPRKVDLSVARLSVAKAETILFELFDESHKLLKTPPEDLEPITKALRDSIGVKTDTVVTPEFLDRVVSALQERKIPIRWPKDKKKSDETRETIVNNLKDNGVVGVAETRVNFHGLRVLEAAENPIGDGRLIFENWEHLDINGRLVPPSQSKVTVPAGYLISETAGRGGQFAEWLFRELKSRKRIEADTGDRVRHQIPPVLYREGFKVQTPWLYGFLRNPVTLRPMTVLRMPRFNMSQQDAQILANYFAAVDGVPYPYQNVPQRAPEYVAAQNLAHKAGISQTKFPDYLSQAWKLLANPKLCRQCHTVGGYPGVPTGDPKKAVQGPNLAYSTDRLRPDWLLLWLAKPSWVTPYTLMPVNFDSTKKVYEESFQGNPDTQWKAVRDALMNYHRLMEQHKGSKFDYPAPKAMSGGVPQPKPRQRNVRAEKLAVRQPGRNDKKQLEFTR